MFVYVAPGCGSHRPAGSLVPTWSSILWLPQIPAPLARLYTLWSRHISHLLSSEGHFTFLILFPLHMDLVKTGVIILPFIYKEMDILEG